MASTEPRTRQRRVHAACDRCKRRKSDGGQPGARCSHCVRSGIDCTHADIFKVRSVNYVAALEQRVEKMEALLRKLLPGIDFTEHLENDTDIEPLLVRPTETLPRNDADSVAQTLSKLKLDPDKNRFFGKSSGIQLVQVALNFQSDLTGVTAQVGPILPSKRVQFWEPALWIFPPPGDDSPEYAFPPTALMQTLVDLYFNEVNPYLPLLHQPTFRAKVADELHLRDHRFAATLLMVCALGARHCDDPSVLLEDAPIVGHTAGWKWHEQVRVLPKNLIYKPDLYELQTVALSSLFLQGLSSTAIAWNQIGFGLRRAQDVGAHRQRRDPCPSADNEHWKRAFWQYVSIGVIACKFLTSTPSFDQDPPVECDDEYWDKQGAEKFKQPSDKPSQMAYFTCLIKLLEIQAAVTSNIYRTRKPKDFSGQASTPSDAQIIVAFDSALNAWLSQVPQHLRWDPDRKDKVYFHQSALLHAKFHYVQILIHRPFIPTGPAQAGALPSLAICTSAARSCVGIFEALLKRQVQLQSFLIASAFTAAIVLLLNAWSGKRSGFAYNPKKELDQIEICLAYRTAGRYVDILTRLMHARARDTLEVLLDLKPLNISAVPPSAQPGYEAYSVRDVDVCSLDPFLPYPV
ncbi:fungal-specific transcription factor domain-containing protein [Mycena amicta]|nr:fungal-specific transcription factor domain-containing protein [Mycena amicta]